MNDFEHELDEYMWVKSSESEKVVEFDEYDYTSSESSFPGNDIY